MKKEKVIGHGFRLSKESIVQALANYGLFVNESSLNKSKSALLKDIDLSRKEGNISKTAKPKKFLIVVKEYK